jgi:hypothetical protein
MCGTIMSPECHAQKRSLSQVLGVQSSEAIANYQKRKLDRIWAKEEEEHVIQFTERRKDLRCITVGGGYGKQTPI